jgi:phenylalanine-4-hydroxylase
MTEFNDFNNPQVANLPRHLRQFIVDQHYEKYTPVDQAVWRYVMRQNYSYLRQVAYYPYIKGLQRAGLSIERIPDLQTMNDNLGKLGWGAVTVDGFIPPAAFMEYQAYRVLVIAADIRQLNHIEYTPAPDIIHESAGHAPIIADKDYNNYLSYIGAIGAKAMFSAADFELYEAIRHLSILKEAVDVDETAIERAENNLRNISDHLGPPSEMALLSRLHWWTVEYGLIGTLEDPKIYGAGLLSSIGESASFKNDDVEKRWYTIDALNYAYDITKLQPQLFVTPTFQNLIDVLEQFADTMSFRRGGAESISKAIACKNPATAQYSSGLQVSGIFTGMELDASAELSYLKTTGPSALSHGGKQLPGHGKSYHKDGFSSPVGKLKDQQQALESLNLQELAERGISIGQHTTLTFQSGITVQGEVKDILRKEDKTILIAFVDCTVTDASGIQLFQPEWGTYDMAIGEKIVSVFNGAADKDAFEEITPMSIKPTVKVHYTESTLKLQQLYEKIRSIRENELVPDELPAIFDSLQAQFPADWLASLEILEITYHKQLFPQLEADVRAYLTTKIAQDPAHQKLIKDGLHVIENPVTQLITEEEQ